MTCPRWPSAISACDAISPPALSAEVRRRSFRARSLSDQEAPKSLITAQPEINHMAHHLPLFPHEPLAEKGPTSYPARDRLRILIALQVPVRSLARRFEPAKPSTCPPARRSSGPKARPPVFCKPWCHKTRRVPSVRINASTLTAACLLHSTVCRPHRSWEKPFQSASRKPALNNGRPATAVRKA